jgi:hypothetical protein
MHCKGSSFSSPTIYYIWDNYSNVEGTWNVVGLTIWDFFFFFFLLVKWMVLFPKSWVTELYYKMCISNTHFWFEIWFAAFEILAILEFL